MSPEVEESDLSSSWPNDVLGNHKLEPEDRGQLDKDLRCVLIEKAAGTVHTRVMNAESRGGMYTYLNVYKWFTETSGLGLAEQSNKLMNPPPAKKEDEIAERVEEWTQQCDRLAKYGAEFNMGNTFKVVALQKILIGETRRVFDTWKIEGAPYEKLLVKLKDYARNKKLDNEASRGQQAVGINAAQQSKETRESTEPTN